MGAPGTLGGRVQFQGDGGNLFVAYLLYYLLPSIGIGFLSNVMIRGASAIDESLGGGGALSPVVNLLGTPIMCAGTAVVSLLFGHKFLEFYFENLVIEGQPCRYTGTLEGLFKSQIVNMVLVVLTFGIYTPWALCKLLEWAYENAEVGGQRGRLTFHGDGASLVGTFILGAILTLCTAYIYGAWFANDLFAFLWNNTRIDGRAFSFKKDPGGFLGPYLINLILTVCTCGLYYPWAICNVVKWANQRVA
jgi:hypothetical protein